MHGVFISSFWQFWFFLKAILPEWVGVNTPFPAPNYVSVARFRGSLDTPIRGFSDSADMICMW
jgi:hypothetical protein